MSIVLTTKILPVGMTSLFEYLQKTFHEMCSYNAKKQSSLQIAKETLAMTEIKPKKYIEKSFGIKNRKLEEIEIKK